jgi:hypothetical protein
MLEVAVSLGTRNESMGGNRVQLLDRPEPISVPGIYLTQTSSKAYLRNLAVFTQ